MESLFNCYAEAIAQPTPIKVILRLKPPISADSTRLSYVEDGAGSISLQDFPQVAGKATFFSDSNDTNKFRFHKIYDVNANQNKVCTEIIDNNVAELLAGYNVSIMVYGSKGSGKAYTMFGTAEQKGIVPRMSRLLFEELDRLYDEIGIESTVSIRFFELYAENVYDLLSVEKGPKSLKTSNDPNTNTLYAKGLRTISITSAEELLSYINESRRRSSNTGSYNRRSRSSSFLNIMVEQRNKREETMKFSVLQFIDLSSSDKLDKNLKSDISTDDIRCINSSMQGLRQAVNALSESRYTQSKDLYSMQQRYRTSRLVKFLQESIGGNSKTTAVMLCSTDIADRENTVATLSFGSRLKSIHNLPVQKKMGLNSKAHFDILLKNMNIREDSYLTRIKYLEDEVSKLSYTIQCNKKDASRIKSLNRENARLSDQLELLRKSHRAQTEILGPVLQEDGKNQHETSEVLDNLMEKCEKVIQLQLRLDEELREKSQISQQLRYKESKSQALEAMNVRLLDQLNINENELKNVLNTNTVLRKNMDRWMHLAKSRSERIEELQSEVQECHVGKFHQNGSPFVTDTPPKTRKTAWLFGNSNFSGTRKISNVSTNSGITSISQESSNSKASHRGFNLHVVRPSSGEEKETSNERKQS